MRKMFVEIKVASCIKPSIHTFIALHFIAVNYGMVKIHAERQRRKGINYLVNYMPVSWQRACVVGAEHILPAALRMRKAAVSPCRTSQQLAAMRSPVTSVRSQKFTRSMPSAPHNDIFMLSSEESPSQHLQ